MPPSHSVGGALSTSLVMSSPSKHPPLEPNTLVPHAPTLGAHSRMGAALSVFGDLCLTLSGSATTTEHLRQGTPPPKARRSLAASLVATTEGSQPVRQHARAGWGAHRGGNGSSHLSSVIVGRLKRQPKASHSRCTCRISWGTLARPSCMTSLQEFCRFTTL
jgi:hypothetical protein